MAPVAGTRFAGTIRSQRRSLGMKHFKHPAHAPEHSELTARLIDALMAQPVKTRPAVTIIGDDDVTGFDPPQVSQGAQGLASRGSSPSPA